MDSRRLRAQHGEDALLAERFSHRPGGYFVEVGALDGEHLSNTFHFEHDLGWTGVLVEPNPEQAASCRRARPGSHVAEVAAVAPGSPTEATLEVSLGDAGYSTLAANRVYARILDERNIQTKSVPIRTATLDAVLAEAGTTTIDFVTIDVEGHELDVLRGFDLARWRPTVVLVESASAAPSLRISWRLWRAGYAQVRRVVVNDWYEQMPPVARTGAFLRSYARSVPTAARSGLREALRAVGLLDRLRAWRASR